ncbi:MAG: SLBB domain-containing protein [Melioribacteraceae bacterium]|nr:SLBB domain-containing protein [Melioribacteraceae bacterium]MCF8262880.1 SLBB domain-containing protein [Melioribacteraceae bacterium]MCF8430892.1 SLBB domain-containing protein [Melioribacteraceae bacterium]
MKKQIKAFGFLFCTLFLSGNIFGQAGLFDLQQTQKLGGFYHDLSDNYKQAIEVTLWGAVSSPGIYKLDKGTSLIELLSNSGGLRETFDLDEIRIIRKVRSMTVSDESNMSSIPNKEVVTDTVLIFDYSQFYDSPDIISGNPREDLLQADDIIIVSGSETEFREELRFYLSLLSTILSITYLIYIRFYR